MDDQGRPAVAEHRMIVAAEIYILVRDGHLARAIRPNHKIRHVAGVVTFRILEPMFLAVGIEMPARRLEVGPLTLRGLMHVHGVLTGWQILKVQLNFHSGLALFQRGRSHTFTFAVFHFHSRALIRCI